MDYPPDKLEIVIASDGSTDRTNEIVRRYANYGVRLLAYARTAGRRRSSTSRCPRLAGEIVLLSDANTHMAPDAVRRLAAWFRDPDVGVVCGRLVLTDPRTGQNVDGLYWKYETFLKKCESRLGALLGSNGGIYAIRKDLSRSSARARSSTTSSSRSTPSGTRAAGSFTTRDAVAREETPPTIRAEFRRRVRIGAGGFQSIGHALAAVLARATAGWP